MKKSILWSCLFSFVVLVATYSLQSSKTAINKKCTVGLVIVATGGYAQLADKLIDSARDHFCTHHAVTYFVFTDRELANKENVVPIYHTQLGWPYDTMMRFEQYAQHAAAFAGMDYLFACDADMLFVDAVGDEILSERVATVHPQVRFKRGPYESNPLSTAHVHRNEGTHYFAGAFYGGTREEFLKLVRTASERVAIDLARGYLAVINDESHLNRYFIDNPPTVLLPPAYCHFESWYSPYPAKLVAFDDPNHDKEVRRKRANFNPIDYYQRFILAGGVTEPRTIKAIA